MTSILTSIVTSILTSIVARIRAWNRDKEHRVKLKIGCSPGKHIELLERLVAAEYDHQKAQEGARANDVRSEFRSGLGADEILPCSIPMTNNRIRLCAELAECSSRGSLATIQEWFAGRSAMHCDDQPTAPCPREEDTEEEEGEDPFREHEVLVEDWVDMDEHEHW